VVHTKATGEITEAVVLAEFLKAGFPVLLPFGENQRYDMVVEVGGRFLRVQVKTASPCGDKGACLRFHATSHDGHRARQGYRGQADVFAAFAPSTGQVYVLPVDDVPETDVWLRLTPARNGQRNRVRMAQDCTLEAWAARQG
jgi:PD-(D/E)XK endonuclease